MFGCGPVDFADELGREVSVFEVSKVSENRFREEKQSSGMVDNQITLSKLGNGLIEIHKASRAPSPTGNQIPRNPRVLVWIRRDLFIAWRFCAADCFPAREGERLSVPKPFKFSRDWWS
jgi:hypothetical protein